MPKIWSECRHWSHPSSLVETIVLQLVGKRPLEAAELMRHFPSSNVVLVSFETMQQAHPRLASMSLTDVEAKQDKPNDSEVQGWFYALVVGRLVYYR